MVTRKCFFTKMNCAANQYSTFMLIGVSADSVIDALNSIEEEEGIGPVISGEETDEGRAVTFCIFKTSPEVIYPLTKILRCKGYTDTDWDETYTLCAENGVDSDDYLAEWNDYYEHGDGGYDAFVKITDPTGITFYTGGGYVNEETMLYYRDSVVNRHSTLPQKESGRKEEQKAGAEAEAEAEADTKTVRWIIGRSGSMMDDVTVEVVEGTKRQVKEYLCGLIRKDWCGVYGEPNPSDDTEGMDESPENVQEMSDGRLYVAAGWQGYGHNDYTATPYDGSARKL